MDKTSPPGFRVVLLPEFPKDADREQVLNTLTTHFGMTREKATSFLSGPPRIIKQGLNQQQALKYQKAVNACGLACRLEWSEGRPPREPDQAGAAPEALVTSDLPSCPNCGYQARDMNDLLITAFDGQGQCPACNIIVAKYGKSRPDAGGAVDNLPHGDAKPAGGPPFVPSTLAYGAGRFRGGRGKIFFLSLGLMAVFLVGYIFMRMGGPPDGQTPPTGRPYSPNSQAAQAARALDDPNWKGRISGPVRGPTKSAAAVIQDQEDRIEALDLAHAQIGADWFDEADIRVEPGETWQGSLAFKLSFESAYLIIPPPIGQDSLGDFMYKDIDLEVSQNPWHDQQVEIAVYDHSVSGYDFPIWVMAEGNRVTSVLYPEDRSVSLEALGQIPRENLGDIQWSRSTRLPADFNPVYDLTQGSGHGFKIEVTLTVSVPETLADYTLGKYVNSRAETVYLKDTGEKKLTLPLTLAKKKGDPALYIRPGKFTP